MADIIIFLILITLGYSAGRYAESRHYKSIQARERKYMNLPTVTFEKNSFDEDKVKSVSMVYGSAVISIDYFKRFLAGLRAVFGGEVSAYETLVDRARREATLRMQEMAAGMNANLIVNFRIETSTIGNQANNKGVGSVEALAYGTALKLEQ